MADLLSFFNRAVAEKCEGNPSGIYLQFPSGTTGVGYVGHLAVALWQIRINVSVFVCPLNCEE